MESNNDLFVYVEVGDVKILLTDSDVILPNTVKTTRSVDLSPTKKDNRLQ
jgi:hypothetical protein